MLHSYHVAPTQMLDACYSCPHGPHTNHSIKEMHLYSFPSPSPPAISFLILLFQRKRTTRSFFSFKISLGSVTYHLHNAKGDGRAQRHHLGKHFRKPQSCHFWRALPAQVCLAAQGQMHNQSFVLTVQMRQAGQPRADRPKWHFWDCKRRGARELSSPSA